MRKIVLSILFFISIANANELYIYSEDKNIIETIESSKISIYRGTPAKKVEDNKVKIVGYINNEDYSKLYATENYQLLIAQNVNKKKLRKIDNNKFELLLKISNDNLTEDAELAWELEADSFYEKCSKCHAAPHPSHYEMVTWEGLYGGMKDKAKPSKEEEENILRYVRAHAKNGIIKEH